MKFNSNALLNYALVVVVLAFTAVLIYTTWFK